jgi:hypothetical protein
MSSQEFGAGRKNRRSSAPRAEGQVSVCKDPQKEEETDSRTAGQPFLILSPGQGPALGFHKAPL